jgi:hypothetical protein
MTPTDAQIEAAAKVAVEMSTGENINDPLFEPEDRVFWHRLAAAVLTAAAEIGPNKTPAKELKEVRAAEREACARVVESFKFTYIDHSKVTCDAIAAAIRARKDT